jgi:phage repressor protein C with HTH and peptisase S24 domain
MNNPKSQSALSDNKTQWLSQADISDLSLVKRIHDALDDRDMAWLSRKTGISTSTLSDYGRGTMPRADKALRIAKALETSVEWLFTGVGPQLIASDLPALDLVEVEEIDLAFGLGGQYTDCPVERTVMQFGRVWLERITPTPSALLTFALGRGDSMVPTIQDSDIVLIDRSITRVHEQDAIWALTIGNIAMIKRVRIRGDQVHLLSDSDRVSTDIAQIDEVVIVGRVIFVGRKL